MNAIAASGSSAVVNEIVWSVVGWIVASFGSSNQPGSDVQTSPKLATARKLGVGVGTGTVGDSLGVGDGDDFGRLAAGDR